MTNTDKHSTEALEARLRQTIGSERPYTVPDGYFEALPQRVMERIRQQERIRRRRRMWRWAAAAVMTGVIAAGGLLLDGSSSADSYEAENEYIEDALDYSMINNMDIAMYLTEAE